MVTASGRTAWGLCLASIIAAGILSRIFHTGFLIFDKYLGDALYGAMVYGIVRLFLRRPRATAVAVVLMVLIELFQLTMIPAGMLSSGHWWTRILARLLGTQFSFLDLLAYGVGICGIQLADRVQTRRAVRAERLQPPLRQRCARIDIAQETVLRVPPARAPEKRN
ncbi:MAG: hypothetical protein JWN34_4259 [Bryobacterales bacterium]|nr:hypothetical protein [Bryobacterales bacterium]